MTAFVPFRLHLARAVTDAIKKVRPADGYTNDLSDYDVGGEPRSRVFRGRPWFDEADPIPMVSVLERPEAAEQLLASPVDVTVGEFDWPLLVQGFVNDDPAHPTDPAYVLEWDVRLALSKERNRIKPGSRSMPDPFGASSWGYDGCAVTGMQIGLPVVRPADDVSSKAYFWLPLTLRIVETLPSG